MTSSSAQTSVPASSDCSSKLLSTRSFTLYLMASSTERVCNTFAPSEASSSISSKAILSSLRAFSSIRGSVV